MSSDPSSSLPETSTARLDAISLSSLLASRLCHDLINPVGALGSGLEVLADEDMDEGMQDAAVNLIKESAEKSIALLKYARLAYGAAGGFGAEIPLEEAQATLTEMYRWSKADLDWRLPAGHASKEIVKTVLILGLAATDCVPRGGKVTVSRDGTAYRIEAEGPRAMLHDDLVSALSGARSPGADETADGSQEAGEASMMPKFAPLYVAGVLVRDAGGDVSAFLAGEKVTMIADFGEVSARPKPASLTAG